MIVALMNLLSILGPTATGKSNIAFKIACRLDAEIISCDSMMIYKGMDIGTAKPAKKMLQSVKHHLIDILEIDEAFDVNSYTQLATKAISQITKKNGMPILCGGTGLYARALLYDYAFLPTDTTIARDIKQDLGTQGKKALIAELAKIDPAQAVLVKDNPHRLLRSLEIIRITGKPMSLYANKKLNLKLSGHQFILCIEPRHLRGKIIMRTEKMINNGWVEETETLVKKGLLTSPTASKALGYSLIADYLEGKIDTKKELIEKIVTKTSQYAKRQRTWFRHQHCGAVLIDVNETSTCDHIADYILSHIN